MSEEEHSRAMSDEESSRAMSDEENARAKRMRLSELPPANDPRMPRFDRGLFLAPMVRIGSLPTRLLSLEYGADLVYGPEVVDRAIMGTERRVDPDTGVVDFVKDGTPIFSCHPIERPYLIYQVGSSTPEYAAEAVRLVTQHDDVAGVDLNCGCPKPFSTLGGMGANLLTEPDKLCSILRAMREAAPPHVSVTCKIRLLPTDEESKALVEQIVRTRTVRAIAIHCRTKPMRPREPALVDRFRGLADHIAKVAAETGQDVPVIYNGDCYGFEDVERVRERTGAQAIMMARGPEANPSCFQAHRVCAASEIAPKWLRYAVHFRNIFGNTKYCMTQLSFKTTAGSKAMQPVRATKLSRATLSEMSSTLSQAKTHEDIAAALKLDPVIDTRGILAPLEAILASRMSDSKMAATPSDPTAAAADAPPVSGGRPTTPALEEPQP